MVSRDDGRMASAWRKVTYLAVGGLTEVGFADGSLLLVISHQGRGVVDLASGELLARDRQETGAWFDADRRAALSPDYESGYRTGRLRLATSEGWWPPQGRDLRWCPS